MTPIEKASKLISYYLPFCNDNLTDAKYCATISVDEIIDALKNNASNSASWLYYEEVKQEIVNN